MHQVDKTWGPEGSKNVPNMTEGPAVALKMLKVSYREEFLQFQEEFHQRMKKNRTIEPMMVQNQKENIGQTYVKKSSEIK